MNTLTTPWVMMNQLQGLKVVVQSLPAQRRQADPRLERSKYHVTIIIIVMLKSHVLLQFSNGTCTTVGMNLMFNAFL